MLFVFVAHSCASSGISSFFEIQLCCISSLILALVGYNPPLMPPLHHHSDPPLMPSLHNYSAQHPEWQQADPSPWLIVRHGLVRDVAIACRKRCMHFVISADLRAKMLNMRYDFTITIRRPLQTVSTLMQDYHTAWSCEGCGDLCVRKLVHEVHGIGRAESLNFRYDLTIADWLWLQ